MKTLTLQDINPFNPGLKWFNTKSGRIITMDYFYSVDEEIFIVCKEEQNHYSLKIWPFKPVLFHISWLTKEIMLPGYEKPVVPIVELAKIAFPGRYFEANGIFADDKKNIFKFHYYQTSFNAFNHSPNAGSVFIPNQYQLFQTLASWRFNFNGIPDHLVEYVTEDFNPYMK